MNRYRRSHYLDTLAHKGLVVWYVLKACRVLLWRAVIHDLSKFSAIEVQGFERTRPLFETATYGSPEYQKALETLGPSLQHHYDSNTHHPEHFGGAIARMSAFDQLEMVCDWIAASRRKRSDIYTSLDINAKRFGLTDEQLESLTVAIGELGL